MLRIVEGFEKTNEPELFDQMFKQRARLFKDKLGWDVKVDSNGWEQDEYDRDDTIYLLTTNHDGQVIGSLRLLSTLTDHMMTGPFRGMFPDFVFRSPTVFECTRFVAEDDRGARANGLSLAACELLIGMFEFADHAGMTQVLGLFEAPMLRVYRRCGLHPSILARTVTEHGQMLVGLSDVSTHTVQAMRQATGLTGPVFTRPRAA
jgi:N-acyl-L-homoserine lactone synthetase